MTAQFGHAPPERKALEKPSCGVLAPRLLRTDVESAATDVCIVQLHDLFFAMKFFREHASIVANAARFVNILTTTLTSRHWTRTRTRRSGPSCRT